MDEVVTRGLEGHITPSGLEPLLSQFVPQVIYRTKGRNDDASNFTEQLCL